MPEVTCERGGGLWFLRRAYQPGGYFCQNAHLNRAVGFISKIWACYAVRRDISANDGSG